MKENFKNLRGHLLLCLLIFMIAAPGYGEHNQDLDKKKQFEKPSVSDMEKDLVDLINKVRLQHNLSLLKSSPELGSLARSHSQDMANFELVMHSSSKGKSYVERLAAERFLFQKAGENVGFSETFVAEIIHQSFMESPEHRDTILDPGFDHIGVGIVPKEGKGYYLTQDFIRSLGSEFPVAEERDREGRLSPEYLQSIGARLQELKGRAQTEIQKIKEKNSLEPFIFLAEADEHASRLSGSNASGQSLPLTPEELQHLHVLFVFITAGSLESALPDFDIFNNPLYHKGGIGIQFSRNEEYPGGAFFITLLLIIDKGYKNMTPQELNQTYLGKVNMLRRRKGIQPMRLNAHLSRQAEIMSKNLGSIQKTEQVIPLYLVKYQVFSFVTQDLLNMPPEIETQLQSSRIRTIGLGIYYREDEEHPVGEFFVTVIY